MKYYQVPADLQDDLQIYIHRPGDRGWRLRCTLVPGELITPGEWKKLTAVQAGQWVMLRPDINLLDVEISTKHVYWSFGCRFAMRHCQNCGGAASQLVPFGMLDVCPACKDKLQRMEDESYA